MARQDCDDLTIGIDWGDGAQDFGTPDASGRIIFSFPGISLALPDDGCLESDTPDSLGTIDDPICIGFDTACLCCPVRYEATELQPCPADPPSNQGEVAYAVDALTNVITCWWDPDTTAWIQLETADCCLVTYCVYSAADDQEYTAVVVRSNITGNYEAPVYLDNSDGTEATPTAPLDPCSGDLTVAALRYSYERIESSDEPMTSAELNTHYATYTATTTDVFGTTTTTVTNSSPSSRRYVVTPDMQMRIDFGDGDEGKLIEGFLNVSVNSGSSFEEVQIIGASSYPDGSPPALDFGTTRIWTGKTVSFVLAPGASTDVELQRSLSTSFAGDPLTTADSQIQKWIIGATITGGLA